MRAYILLITALGALVGLGHDSRQKPEQALAPRFPSASSDGAWKLLPREKPPLPAWALVLIESLPRTTGAMLELDHLHRAKNPLGPVLAGKLRWLAADAIGCDYGKRTAEADLRRAGLGDDDFEKLTGNSSDVPAADRALFAFARKLTKAGHTVTDAEVEELIKVHGPAKAVAIVHTLAFANFQNRISLALGVEIEKGGPLPPLDLRIDRAERAKINAPERQPWEDVLKAEVPSDKLDLSDWRKKGFGELEKCLAQQKGRKARIQPPDETQLALLPAEVRKRVETKILWSKVSLGYQSALTGAWFDCMDCFHDESQQNRVFSNLVFWVVTRSNECFY
jgi:alkylhydroperoxidase family enzyme